MIQTQRLELRPWTETEAPQFFDLTQDDGFNSFLITIYKQKDLDSAREWVRRNLALHHTKGLGKWGVWNKSDRSLIGMGGLTPLMIEGTISVDLTYRLRTSAWGNGYASELARALIRHGFGSLALQEITATITPDNHPSKKIAEKLGFRFDKRIVLMGVETDLFRLSKENYER